MLLTGVGLAWLFMGQSRDTTSQYDERDTRGGPGMQKQRDTAERSFSRHRSETAWDQNDSDRYDASGIDRSWIDDHWRDTSRGGVNHNTDKSGIVGNAAEKVGAGMESVKGGVSHAATAVTEKVSDLADRFLHGTDGFSDEAKARVKAARQTAYDAKLAAEDALRTGGRKATDLFEDQPLVVGALAMALGAAIGSALPHTKTEDDAMGATSQNLFAEAQRIFAEKRTKAMAVVTAVTDEAKNTFTDAKSELAALVPEGKTAVDAVVDRVGDAASRVFDSAKEEADRQGLGQIND